MLAITCSRGTNPFASGSATQRLLFEGTLRRTNRVRPPSLVMVMARLKLRLLMNGNGWAASTARGVRIGRTDFLK